MEDYIIAENYKKIDAYKNYWDVNGETREMFYKLNSVEKILKDIIIIQDNTNCAEIFKNKEKRLSKIKNLCRKYSDFNTKVCSMGQEKIQSKGTTVVLNNIKDVYSLAIDLTSILIESFDLFQEIQLEIQNCYFLINEIEKNTYQKLIIKCKNPLKITLGLQEFMKESYLFDSSKDYDRIDNICFSFESKDCNNSKFEKMWKEKNASISLHKQVVNRTRQIERQENLYQKITESNILLLSQLEREKELNSQKNLNTTMLLLTAIGTIGVLVPFFNNAIPFSDAWIAVIFILFLVALTMGFREK